MSTVFAFDQIHAAILTEMKENLNQVLAAAFKGI